MASSTWLGGKPKRMASASLGQTAPTGPAGCVISSHFNIWLATSTTVPAQHLLLETCRNSVETSLQAASRRCANRQYDLGLYLNTWGATSGPKIKVLAIFGSCAKGHNEGRWRKQKIRKSWWSMGKKRSWVRVCVCVRQIAGKGVLCPSQQAPPRHPQEHEHPLPSGRAVSRAITLVLSVTIYWQFTDNSLTILTRPRSKEHAAGTQVIMEQTLLMDGAQIAVLLYQSNIKGWCATNNIK